MTTKQFSNLSNQAHGFSDRVLLELAVRSGQVDSKQIAAHEEAGELRWEQVVTRSPAFDRIVQDLTSP